MTSEVAIMNRRAIALAADSAVTVTSIQNGRRQQKYFKGANKVFELSHHHPVGVMIFDSADVHSVPWEIVIKAYREQLGDQAFPTLEEYAKDLFSYIQNHSGLFPPAKQEELFKAECINAVLGLLEQIETDPRVVSAPDDAQKMAARAAIFAEAGQLLATHNLPNHFPSNAVVDAQAKFIGELKTQANSLLSVVQQRGVDPDLALSIAIEAIFKHYDSYLAHTGIVVAGYGEGDYFPGLIQYSCWGIVLGTFIADEKKNRHVTADDGSVIEPFAMNDMVETFMIGMSPDIFEAVKNGLQKSLTDLEGAVKAELNVGAIPNIDVHTEASRDSFMQALIRAQVDAHYGPLTRAVASLPVDELAGLAETLISLESLKEKVTRPSESVGGPVDVAVITKAESLVWIRRKHYFPAELNTKFLERQRNRLGC